MSRHQSTRFGQLSYYTSLVLFVSSRLEGCASCPASRNCLSNVRKTLSNCKFHWTHVHMQHPYEGSSASNTSSINGDDDGSTTTTTTAKKDRFNLRHPHCAHLRLLAWN